MEEDDVKDRGRGKARTMEREPQRSNKEQDYHGPHLSHGSWADKYK